MDYKAIADELAGEIEAGRLRPGERLPPQREFAYRRGIAASTAARVYAALMRKGLVTGEVGRGTYVRSTTALAGPALSEPGAAPIDLELNFPMLAGQAPELARSLAGLMRPDRLAQALRPIGAAGTPAARDLAARFLARGGWKPRPESLLFTGNGRQAIAAVLSAVAAPGTRVGVEALTYPVLISIATRLGIELIAIDMDGFGMRPDALAAAHRGRPLKAICLQPFLHNPLGVSMTLARRQEIAVFLEAQGVIAIEDAIYAFLVDDAPLAALAADHVVVVDSLSKRLAPGLTLGFISAPPNRMSGIANALRAGAWGPAGVPFAAAMQWIADGTAARLATAKRADAGYRQELARAALAGLSMQADVRAYHLWLELPDHWRAGAYVAAASRLGISIVPASAFAVDQGFAPNAVRLALASPAPAELSRALVVLAELALSSPTERDVG
nr:PLP-dependent aminotransferase family protein [Phreatobacter stygius]